MSRAPAGPRCEVCTARLDAAPANRPPRCGEHAAQQALFPLAALPGRRRRATGDDLSPDHDRHHTTTGRPVSRTRRTRKD